MNKRILLVAALLSLVACSSNTTGSISDNTSSTDELSSGEDVSSDADRSSGARSSGANSSGAPGSSSSFTPLPDVDSSLVAGPDNLKVSSLAGPKSLVLTWTDVTTIKRDDYLGYKIYRNDNYSGWKVVGEAPPQKQFYKDTTLDPSGEYKYIYRIIAFDSTSKGKDTLISKYSNEAGTLPLTSLGFGEVIFDEPTDFTITRWGPSLFELKWSISGKKPELGMVVQKLSTSARSMIFPIDSTDFNLSDSISYWVNVDTLGQDDNHFFVYDSVAFGRYRIFAFYSEEFGRIISEFSPEVSTDRAPYDSTVKFLAPTAWSRIVSSTTIQASWVQNHNDFVEAANTDLDFEKLISPYKDTVYYEIEEFVSDKDARKFTQPLDAIQFVNDGLSTTDVHNHICSYSYRVRLFWRDRWGRIDRTDWSVLSGTSGGTVNIMDPNEFCKL